MKVISSYKELNGEIEILALRITDLRKEYRRIVDKMLQGPSGVSIANYSFEPRAGFVTAPLDKQYARLGEIEKKIAELEEDMKPKLDSLRAMKEKMKELEGLEYKVFYAHKVEGKSLNQVAGELNYTPEYIRKINAELNKEKAPAI